MKQKNSLNEDLKKIFKKELKIKVNLNSKYLDFEEWDSMGNFNVLLACEVRFKIKFNSNEFNKLNSFKEISEVVQKKLKKYKKNK